MKKVSLLSIIEVGLTIFFFFPLAPILARSFVTALGIHDVSVAVESSPQIKGFPAKGDIIAIRALARSTDANFARFFASISVVSRFFILFRNSDSFDEGASFLFSTSWASSVLSWSSVLGSASTPFSFIVSLASVCFEVLLGSPLASILTSLPFSHVAPSALFSPAPFAVVSSSFLYLEGESLFDLRLPSFIFALSSLRFLLRESTFSLASLKPSSRDTWRASKASASIISSIKPRHESVLPHASNGVLPITVCTGFPFISVNEPVAAIGGQPNNCNNR